MNAPAAKEPRQDYGSAPAKRYSRDLEKNKKKRGGELSLRMLPTVPKAHGSYAYEE